jgi:neutral ceramidase
LPTGSTPTMQVVAVITGLMSAAGCSAFLTHQFAPRGEKITVPAYRVATAGWRPGHNIAGVARVDITPPAGYPTGGHGPPGSMARGYWTRLYARAFFFTDSTGSPLVLVSSDFFAVPGGLAAEVRRRVATAWAKRGLSIPPEAIIIAATHTHHGPGNYLTAGTYNAYGSRYPGFDRRLFDFLTDRITQAIDSAISDAREGGPATVWLRRGQVTSGLLLNRSASTFMSNWNAAQIMDRLNPPGPVDCRPRLEAGEAREKDWSLPGCPRLRALDRTLTILEVERSGRRLGMLMFLAAHPTVLEAGAPFYSSDFVGRALAEMERRSSNEPRERLVAGFFNGAEGDVVPRRSARDIRDVERVKDTLLANVDMILKSPRQPVGAAIVTHEARLRAESAFRDATGRQHQLAKFPLFGKAALGGAEDDRSVFYTFGWREGAREVPGENHGDKLGALDSQLLPFLRLTRILAPPHAFPSELPIGYAQLGSLTLVTVPVELSTAAGLMIRDSLRSRGRVEIVGLSNEYSSYLATPDEYAAQDYMGASTIWGPDQSSLFTWATMCLAAVSRTAGCSASANPQRVVAKRVFFAGRKQDKIRGEKKPFGPFAVGDALSAVDDELERVVHNANGVPERNLPWFEWTETSRGDSDDFTSTAHRTVSVQMRVGSSWITRTAGGPRSPDDDTGGNFLTLMRKAPARTGQGRHERHWSAIWLAPVLDPRRPDGVFRFRVLLSDQPNEKEILSCPFVVNLSPSTRHTAVKPLTSSCD